MIIEAFLVSLLVGLIRKGRLRNLADMPLRHYYAFILPILIIGVTSTLAVRHQIGDWSGYVHAANVLQYVGLLAAIALNFHIWEIRLAGIGILMNGIVVSANGGMMPCSVSAAKIAGVARLLEGEMGRHCVMTAQTKLGILGDWIAVPPPPFAPAGLSATLGEVCSIGDFVVAVAVFLLIQRYMCLKSPKEQQGK